ncbi:DUF805 domain-containing protein [Actinomycetaceae bacterium L2_0104]
MGAQAQDGPRDASGSDEARGNEDSYERFRPKPLTGPEVFEVPDSRIGSETVAAAGPGVPGTGRDVRAWSEPIAHPPADDAPKPRGEWEEDHWPFAPPLVVQLVSDPPGRGGSSNPRPMPLEVRSPAPAESAGYLPRYPQGVVDGEDEYLSLPLYGATVRQSLQRFIKKRRRFSGFASPSEFWWMVLLQGIVWSFILILAAFLSDPSLGSDPNATPDETVTGIFGTVLIVFIGLTLQPNLSLLTRRLHDAGLPGSLGWILLLPGLGWLGLLFCLLLPSRSPDERKPEWEDRTGD